jgi:hypothetical protein
MTTPLTDQQLAAQIECAIGLTQDCGGTAGVHAVRDAVLAVVRPELDQLRASLAEMTRCRDAAIRQARRDDIDVEPHLDDLFADGLHGLYEWTDQPQPDAAPDLLVNTCVALIRPVLAKLTEQRDQARAELATAQHAAFHKAADVLDDIASKQDCFDDQQSQADAEHTRSSARAIRIYAAATADAPKPSAAVPGTSACHSTRHCVTWGFCHRCAPELSAQAVQRLGESAGSDRPEVYAAIVADLTGADADEWVRCSGLHCPNSERFTKAAERGWLHGHMDTWQCPKCRATAGSAPTATP